MIRKIVFTRVSDVNAQFYATLRNVSDLEENFVITKATLDTFIECELFFYFNKRRWTLNEMIFFAQNNEMTISIFDKNDILLKTYPSIPIRLVSDGVMRLVSTGRMRLTDGLWN